MSNRKRRDRKRRDQSASLEPGSNRGIELRRQVSDLRTENRILRAQVGQLDPPDWPPRYRGVISRLTGTPLELGEASSPLKGRVLQPAGRSGPTDSLRDEGVSTRASRRMMDQIVKDINGVLDGTYNPSLSGKRCRRSPNQCPMSNKVQHPRFAGHVLHFCGGCGHPFPSAELGPQSNAPL